MIREALVLAGGFGTRLGALTKETPKPVLPVGGKPFLQYVLWNLRRQGVQRAVLSVGYLADRVQEALKDVDMEIEYVVEDEPLGTGGAVRLAADRLGERFFVLNGDTLFDTNVVALDALKRPAAMALRAVPDVARYGETILENGLITGFREKTGQGPGLISGGVYVLDKTLLKRLPEGVSSIERDLFVPLAADRALGGLPSDGFFIDIGLPETLDEANRTVPAWRKKPLVLLDRDGVLNDNKDGYVHRPEDLSFMPDAPEAVRYLNDKGFLVAVVTNQAGIGRGLYDEPTFHAFMTHMQNRLAERGAHFDDVRFCPNHPEHGLGAYKVACDRRKPAPGMLLEAIAHLGADASKTVMVGDSETDVQAAEAAGVRGVRYNGGSLLEVVRQAAEGLI